MDAGFASLFVAIFAAIPVSTLALVVYVACAIVLAFIAGRHRQVGLSFTATLIPAAIGMMATIQQPALLEPLTPLACQEGETLVSRSARVVDTSRLRDDPHASQETVFWTACETPGASRQTYAPLFVHGLALLLLFGVSNRVGRHAFATPP